MVNQAVRDLVGEIKKKWLFLVDLSVMNTQTFTTKNC